MNIFHWGALLIAVGIAPCGYVAYRAGLFEGIVALQLAGQLATVSFLLTAAGSPRQSFASLAIVLAMASTAGTLFFVRYLERRS